MVHHQQQLEKACLVSKTSLEAQRTRWATLRGSTKNQKSRGVREQRKEKEMEGKSKASGNGAWRTRKTENAGVERQACGKVAGAPPTLF